MTFLSLVHPVDRHGTSQVSGMSRAAVGPSARSNASTSRRQPSFAATQSRRSSCHSFSGGSPGHTSMSAATSATSSLGSRCALCSTSAPSPTSSSRSAGSYDAPRRVHSARSACSATTLVRSTCRNPRCRTTSSTSVGSLRGEQLRAYGDPAGLLAGQVVHVSRRGPRCHAAILGARSGHGLDRQVRTGGAQQRDRAMPGVARSGHSLMKSARSRQSTRVLRHAVAPSTSQHVWGRRPAAIGPWGAAPCGTPSRPTRVGARCTCRTTFRARTAGTLATPTCRAPTAAPARATACSRPSDQGP